MYFSSASDCCKAADTLQRMEDLAIILNQVERAFVPNARVRRRLCEQERACLDMILDPAE